VKGLSNAPSLFVLVEGESPTLFPFEKKSLVEGEPPTPFQAACATCEKMKYKKD